MRNCDNATTNVVHAELPTWISPALPARLAVLAATLSKVPFSACRKRCSDDIIMWILALAPATTVHGSLRPCPPAQYHCGAYPAELTIVPETPQQPSQGCAAIQVNRQLTFLVFRDYILSRQCIQQIQTKQPTPSRCTPSARTNCSSIALARAS